MKMPRALEEKTWQNSRRRIEMKMTENGPTNFNGFAKIHASSEEPSVLLYPTIYTYFVTHVKPISRKNAGSGVQGTGRTAGA
jgi:hypothetical protein